MHACQCACTTQALGGLCSRSLEALQQQLPHDAGAQPPCAARHEHLPVINMTMLASIGAVFEPIILSLFGGMVVRGCTQELEVFRCCAADIVLSAA